MPEASGKLGRSKENYPQMVARKELLHENKVSLGEEDWEPLGPQGASWWNRGWRKACLPISG